MSDFWYWDKSRVISLVIAGIYLSAGLFFLSDKRLLIILALFLILPLGCIWFADEVGGFEGPTTRGYVRKTPAIFMEFGGWALLFLPALLGIIYWGYKK